ncbi:hypothetical protein AAG906_011033 [Vitis piasezkii]
MEGSAGIGVGFMAVFAVSGSAVLIALQLHKRLLSDFMKKIESEIGGSGNYQAKKKVRFAETVVEPSSNNKEYRLKHTAKAARAGGVASMKKMEDTMPLNRRILYKGIIEYKALRGHCVSN